MLVEMYEENGFWCFKDISGVTYSTHQLSSLSLMEAKSIDGKDNIKKVIKLKEAGFTSDKIIEMSKENVV